MFIEDPLGADNIDKIEDINKQNKQNDKMISLSDINPNANVPYYAYEATNARLTNIINRLIVALIIAVISILISNGIWLYAWMQYDYSGSTTETVELKSDSAPANYIRGDGGIITNGKDKGSRNEEEDSQQEEREVEGNESEEIKHE